MVGRLSGQVAVDMEKTFRIRLHSRQAQAGDGASGVHGRRARVSADAYKGPEVGPWRAVSKVVAQRHGGCGSGLGRDAGRTVAQQPDRGHRRSTVTA